MSKPKFYGSDAGLPVKFNSSIEKPFQTLLPEITISNFTCQQLLVNVQNNVKKERPSLLIFKWLDNKKVELDIEHQRLIIDQIRNLRTIQDEVIHLQAEAVFSYEMVKMLVAGMKAKAEKMAKDNALALLQVDQEIDIAPIKHKDEIDQIEHEQAMRKLLREKLEEEVKQMRARTTREEKINEIIENTLANVDFSSLSEQMVLLVFNSQLNPQGNEYVRDYIQQCLSKYMFQQEELKTRREAATTVVVEKKSEVATKQMDNIINVDTIRHPDKS